MSNPEEIKIVESLFLDLSILRIATIYFAEENKLDEGGFEAVYKVARNILKLTSLTFIVSNYF